jgi:hypothetical protein
MGPCLAVEGATTKAVFETCLEHVVAPTLRPAQEVVVMDNLSLTTRSLGYARSSNFDGNKSQTRRFKVH